MPYEIPQQLQYEERVLFGLTFKQVVYAAIFIVPALVMFLKTNLGMYVKITIATFLIGTAILFMFFNFSSYIRNMISWFKFREVSINQQKMVRFLGIEKIKDGTVYVNQSKKYH